MSSLAFFKQMVPPEIIDISGGVFYSGRCAFTDASHVYLLGLNPGGCPVKQADETVRRQLDACSKADRENWSAYVDESWLGKAPGTHGMQPRVIHLCQKLGLDPRKVPSSNLIFQRSAREAHLRSSRRLIDLCWPFHAAVIQKLNIRMVICFGKTVGTEVRNRLGANMKLDEFREMNKRRWQSTMHTSERGVYVATLTHPSIAAWNVPVTDPTRMVARFLNRITETAVR